MNAPLIESAFLGYAQDFSKGGLGLYVRVCASCPDRASLEKWAHARGLPVSHGYCPECAARMMANYLGERDDSCLTGNAESPA